MRYTGPINTLSMEDALYLSGLFDGESCIRVSIGEYSGRDKMSVEVKLVMVHKPTMEWVSHKIGRPIKVFKVKSKNARDAWVLRVANIEGVYSLLTQLRPYLKTKKAVAEVAISFCESRRSKGATKYIETEKQLAMQSSFLNRVGLISQEIH